jgi:hypothetical protein
VWKLAATLGVLIAAATGAAFGILRGDETREVLPRLPEREMPGRLLIGFQDEPTLRWGRPHGNPRSRAESRRSCHPHDRDLGAGGSPPP